MPVVNRYSPGSPPQVEDAKLAAVLRAIWTEFSGIAAALNTLADGHLDVTNVAPTRAVEGDIRYADGVHWNPGFGKGLYQYRGGAWISIEAGTAVGFWDYTANTAIVAPPPPSGDVYWNNATQTSATVIGFSVFTTDNYDIEQFLKLIVAGDHIILQDANNSANFQTWAVSGAITVSAGSYITAPVTLIASGGTGTTNFPNNHQLFMALIT